mgnify:CR=1 FL=1
MIDTDKYEGHTPVRKEWPRWCEDWLFSVYSDDGSHIPNWNQDNSLACDAPLLLAEVKRLQERLSMWEDWFKQGAANKMQDGDAYDIIFHNHDTCLSECSKHCDYKCWICQTKELIGND